MIPHQMSSIIIMASDLFAEEYDLLAEFVGRIFVNPDELI